MAWRKGEYAYGRDGGTPELHLGYIMIVFSVLDFFRKGAKESGQSIELGHIHKYPRRIQHVSGILFLHS